LVSTVPSVDFNTFLLNTSYYCTAFICLFIWFIQYIVGFIFKNQDRIIHFLVVYLKLTSQIIST
jgi:hypothetical protein